MKRMILILLMILARMAWPSAIEAYEPIDARAVTFYLQGVFFESRFDLQAAREMFERASRYDKNNPRIQLSLAGVYLLVQINHSPSVFYQPQFNVLLAILQWL